MVISEYEFAVWKLDKSIRHVKSEIVVNKQWVNNDPTLDDFFSNDDD